MFINILKKLTPWIIVVGLVVWAFGIYQSGISVIEQQSINYGTFTWYYYRIDVSQYIQNLQESFDITQMKNIRITVPELPIVKVNNAWDAVKNMINGMALMVNGVILIANTILVAPLKIILYPINMLFALLGLNTANEGIVGVFKDLYNLNIPYIPPLV